MYNWGVPLWIIIELVLEEKIDDRNFGTNICLSSCEELAYRFLEWSEVPKSTFQMYIDLLLSSMFFPLKTDVFVVVHQFSLNSV